MLEINLASTNHATTTTNSNVTTVVFTAADEDGRGLGLEQGLVGRLECGEWRGVDRSDRSVSLAITICLRPLRGQGRQRHA